MLQNWLKSLPTSFCKTAVETRPEWSFAQNILIHRTEMPSLKNVRAAIIGVGEEGANAIRSALYGCSFPFPKGSVADLGNLRKTDAALLIPVLYELLSGKIIPIVLASDAHLARAQFLAYQEAKSLVNLAVIDEQFSENGVYTPLFAPRHPQLFHFASVGLQVHQTPSSAIDFLQKPFAAQHLMRKVRQVLSQNEM